MMTTLILLFAAFTFFAGIIIIIDPEKIFGLLSQHTAKLGLQISAVVVRIVIGGLLILQSGESEYPIIIEIVGGLSIAAAIFFAVIGRNNFKRIISWALSLSKPFGRLGGVFAACFGAFLIYAFVSKSE